MKKSLFLIVLIFISSSSFAQIIVNKRVVEMGKKLVMVKSTGEIRKNDKIITEKFNITEIQDEFIEVRLGKNFHYLSTSKHKNIKISSHWKKKYWNVYDEGKLIPLQDEVDVLNFFNKYGFEYFKQNTKTKGGNTVSIGNYSTTSISSKSSITLKNNNN